MFEKAINYDRINELTDSELKVVSEILKGIKLPPKNMVDSDYIETMIAKYYESGGEVATVEEGSLGYGVLVMYGYGLKTTVVIEHYANEWSSYHTAKTYRKMPKKYERLLIEKGWL